jgi:type VI secretion system protein ImpM
MTTVTQAPGWFGKLSCLGDFASRRLPPEWKAHCDDWLSACLSHGQAQLGADWLPTYLAAPVWRFVWAPQVTDTQWWFGVLMPSCDAVGRYYPLLLAQPRAQPPADRYALAHLDLWWTQMAQAALATLADGASVDSFETALDHAPPWPSAPGAVVRSNDRADGLRWALPAHAEPGDLALAMAVQTLQERLLGQTLWWPWHGDGRAGSCWLMPGLPTPERFSEMLSAS